MEDLLKVVICDDEKTAISIISASVEALLVSRGIQVEVNTFTSIKKCYSYVKSNPIDLLFLDIAMPEADGITAAQKIVSLKLEKHPDIIFVSSNQNRVFDSFQVQPFGFVRKDNFMQDITNVLKRYVDTKLTRKEEIKQFELRDGKGVSVLNAASVIYIESYRNIQTVFLTENKSIKLHSTMDNVTQQVKNFDFIRIHKGYIVGCKHINSFGRNDVTLSNGRILPVGRVYYKEAIERYMTYIRISGIKTIG